MDLSGDVCIGTLVASVVMDVRRITDQRSLFDPNGLSQGESN